MMRYQFLAVLVLLINLFTVNAAESGLVIEGKEGIGKGQHVVFVTGEEYYRSEEGMSMFAKILSQHHGYKCTVLFAMDPVTGFINANKANNIPGLEALKSADLMVVFARFRELPDADMKHIVDYVNAGKPVLGIRNATHAFRYSANSTSPYKSWDFQSKAWLGGFWTADSGRYLDCTLWQIPKGSNPCDSGQQPKKPPRSSWCCRYDFLPYGCQLGGTINAEGCGIDARAGSIRPQSDGSPGNRQTQRCSDAICLVQNLYCAIR
ncbi:MAG: hypothetical protein EBQ87_01390 [Planctomycetes bacterium]|nr:hypothetical protein [Planctomycetota bacterium]